MRSASGGFLGLEACLQTGRGLVGMIPFVIEYCFIASAFA